MAGTAGHSFMEEVENPSHYQLFPRIESITVIASALTPEQWYGFCLGNTIKYRLRAGKKGEVNTDLGKSDFYPVLYERHLHLCRKPDDQ